jgi:hypothetical protein
MGFVVADVVGVGELAQLPVVAAEGTVQAVAGQDRADGGPYLRRSRCGGQFGHGEDLGQAGQVGFDAHPDRHGHRRRNLAT